MSDAHSPAYSPCLHFSMKSIITSFVQFTSYVVPESGAVIVVVLEIMHMVSYDEANSGNFCCKSNTGTMRSDLDFSCIYHYKTYFVFSLLCRVLFHSVVRCTIANARRY